MLLVVSSRPVLLAASTSTVSFVPTGEKKIAEHEFLLCLESPPLWHRLPRRLQRCLEFLRKSPGTNYSSSAWQVNLSGNVNSVSIDDYVDNSYGHLTR